MLILRPFTARACGVKEPIIIEVVVVQSPHITLGCWNNFRSLFPLVLFELLLSSLGLFRRVTVVHGTWL